MICEKAGCGGNVPEGVGKGFISGGLRYVACEKCKHVNSMALDRRPTQRRGGPAYNRVNYDKHCPSLVPILDEAHTNRANRAG